MMTHALRTKMALATVTLFSLLLVACGGTDEPQTTQADPPADDTDTDEAADADDTDDVAGDEDDTDDVGEDADDAGTADGELRDLRMIRATFWNASTGGGFFSAYDQGWFADVGLDPDTLVGSGGGTAVTALISGSADVGQSLTDSFLNAVGQGADMVAFWNYLRPGIFFVMGNGDSGITEDVESLRGQTIGIIGPASATYFVTQMMLEGAGMTEDDVEFVTIGCCTAQYSLLLDGTVDAIGTWDVQAHEILSQAENDAETEWLDQLVEIHEPRYLSDIWITTRDFYEQEPELLVDFVYTFMRGLHHAANEPEDMVQRVAPYIDGMDPDDPVHLEIAEMRADGFVPDGQWDYDDLRESLELYHAAGLINVDPGPLDLSRLFINDIAAEAYERLQADGIVD